MSETFVEVWTCSYRAWGRVKIFLVVSTLIAASSVSFAGGDGGLHCYSYISPPAMTVLEHFGISEAEIVNFARREIESRSIFPIDANRIYEGSEDDLRIDIRKKPDELVIELSVRQGGSIHNMLERWSARQFVPIQSSSSPEDARRKLFDSMSYLLDDLNSKYFSKKYRQGEMVPEDYQPEKDE